MYHQSSSGEVLSYNRRLWFIQAWSATRSPVCVAGGRRNPNCKTRVSSQAAEWDLYCAAAEELAMIDINGYNNHNGRGFPLAAAKIPNDGSGYYNCQSLQYQKLQAIQVINRSSLTSIFHIWFLWVLDNTGANCLFDSVSAANDETPSPIGAA